MQNRTAPAAFGLLGMFTSFSFDMKETIDERSETED